MDVITAADAVQNEVVDALLATEKVANLTAFVCIAVLNAEESREFSRATNAAHDSVKRVAEKVDALLAAIREEF